MQAPARVALVFLLLSVIVEVSLLFLITMHPAGGWGQSPLAAFASLCVLGLLPLAIGIVLVAREPAKHYQHYSQFVALLPLVATGPLLFSIALASYGRGTPGLIFFAWMLQWISLALAWRRFVKKPDSTSNGRAA